MHLISNKSKSRTKNGTIKNGSNKAFVVMYAHKHADHGLTTSATVFSRQCTCFNMLSVRCQKNEKKIIVCQIAVERTRCKNKKE